MSKIKQLEQNADAALRVLRDSRESLWKAATTLGEARTKDQPYTAEDPQIGSVIAYPAGAGRHRSSTTYLLVDKITEKRILGRTVALWTDFAIGPERSGSPSRRTTYYQTYLTAEEWGSLQGQVQAMKRDYDAFIEAHNAYFKESRQELERQQNRLATKRNVARHDFYPYEYYDAYPEISIKIDGRSGGYEVEISDFSVEDYDERRYLTVPKSALVDLIAKVIDAAIEQGEEDA